jgi:transcriptional regulator with XRE-family HTH domain
VVPLNERIKKLRKALDLTQQEFADKIGMKRNTVANYETDRNEPSNSVISLICKTFNVSETWLRTGEGEMFVERTRDDELAAFMDELLAEESADFRRWLVTALSRLKPEQWEALEAVALELMKDPAAPAFAPAHTPTIEEEARAEAEQQAQLIYQQILSEKKAAAGMLSESSEPLAGGGTARHA